VDDRTVISKHAKVDLRKTREGEGNSFQIHERQTHTREMKGRHCIEPSRELNNPVEIYPTTWLGVW
jgi:hypothetical protein